MQGAVSGMLNFLFQVLDHTAYNTTRFYNSTLQCVIAFAQHIVTICGHANVWVILVACIAVYFSERSNSTLVHSIW